MGSGDSCATICIAAEKDSPARSALTSSPRASGNSRVNASVRACLRASTQIHGPTSPMGVSSSAMLRECRSNVPIRSVTAPHTALMSTIAPGRRVTPEWSTSRSMRSPRRTDTSTRSSHGIELRRASRWAEVITGVCRLGRASRSAIV